MLHGFNSLLVPAFAERLTLVLNHVLGSEVAAVARLRPHAGATVQLLLEDWPGLLPPPPPLSWSITPAGLLQWSGEAGAAPLASQGGLVARLDASNPALLLVRMLAGEAPGLRVDGNAQLATDVNWLIQNLHWDVAADLDRVFGPVAGQQLHRVGSAVAAALRKALSLAVRGAAEAGQRLRPRGV